jgi:hypothetical protein
MTTKTLTSSNYPGGYFLNTNYSGLVIDPGVSVGSSSSLIGVYATDAATIVNYGTVAASENKIGVFLKAGGTVINGSASDKTALITSGVETEGASSTLSNFGTIQSADPGGGFCVYVGAGGSVTNGSASDTTAVISDSTDDCVVSAAATTVTNFGTISSSTGAAVYFESSAGRLIVEKSAVFVGGLKGGGGTLELAGGNDTITGLGGAGAMTGSTSTNFIGFGTYIVDTGADLTLTGINDLTTGQSLTVAGALVNTGTLTGPTTPVYGVTLSGGTLTNGSATDTAALITGNRSGVYATVGTTVTIGNFGTIQATGAGNSVGVNMDGNGRVTNGSAADTTALIEGGFGVYSLATTTITNFGTIDGAAGTAVEFHEAADRLIVESKSVFVGALAGGGGTLELAVGSDTITGMGGAGKMTGATSASFSGFGTYIVDTGADLTLTGANALTTGQSLTVTGALVNTGAISGAGTLALNGGTATFDAGTSLTVSHVSQSAGTVTSADPTLSYAGVWDQTGGTLSVSSGDKITFTGTGNSFSGTLAGAGTIDFTGGSDTLSGASLSVTNATVSGSTVALVGAITLTDTLVAASPKIVIGAAGATLAGGGRLELTNASTNLVLGDTASATLTNDVVIFGAGDLGDGQMTLDNAATGTIEGDDSVALTINTGTKSILNAGDIVAVTALTIDSPVDNTGELLAAGGTLTVKGAVTGSGKVVTSGVGVVDFTGTGNVFSGAVSGTGTLDLSGGTDAFDAGTSLTIAKVTQSAGTVTIADPTLSYAGVWDQTAGTLSASSGDKITFTGTGNVFSGTLTGAGTVDLTGGSDTLSGATLSASTGVIVSGSTVTLTGTLDITDTLEAASPQIIVAAGGATLSGGGRLELTNAAANTIVGANAGATLTTNDVIFGAGDLGDGTMTLDNGATGIIEGDDSVALTINTGSNAILNAGDIVALTAVTIYSAVSNTGLLLADGGTLTADGAITGAGHAEVEGAGTLILQGAFNQNVTFAAGSTGTLELGDSKGYTTGAITGFSKTGANALDLLDIAFVSGTTTATYSGATTSGVLTVKDGANVATIHLIGNYLGSTFSLTGAGGGTEVIDPARAPAAAPVAGPISPHPFIAAMAGFGARMGAGASAMNAEAGQTAPSVALPRAQIA